MRTLGLIVLFVVAGCVTHPPRPPAPTTRPATKQTLPYWLWRELRYPRRPASDADVTARDLELQA